jgi:PhnB protein
MDFVTYLSFDGQCEAAFKHYEKVFGGKILMMVKNADAPPGTPITHGTENRIMHARLEAGGRLLMGGDAPPQYVSKPQGFCVSVQVDSPAEAERIFGELAKGGNINMPIAETFWAQRFGMLIDKFGIPWMVNCEKVLAATGQQSSSAKPAKVRK